MGKADLHVHSRVSDGMASVDAILEYTERKTRLDVIAITDHEDVRGGLEARELAAKRGYRVGIVTGAEITTRHGHLLALFIESTPPSFRSVEATVEAIHAQGGLAIVPHPMSWLTRSISNRTLRRLLETEDEGTRLDGIELANPSPAGKLTRAKAAAANETWGLAATGGSDAHHLGHVGTGWTEFEGTTTEQLRKRLMAGATTARMASYPSMKEIGFGQIALGLAWGYAATPRKMLQRLGSGRRS